MTRVKSKPKKPTLKQLVAAARKEGVNVTTSIQPIMPMRLPNDHAHVLLLIDESERASTLGNKWLQAATPNQIAAEVCLRNGWAYSLAAAWLRCALKGEVGTKNNPIK